MHKIFCGGVFCFDYREKEYKVKAAKDYRSKLLGNAELLLIPMNPHGVSIYDSVQYVGPFYFETESMKAEDIIRLTCKVPCLSYPKIL